MSDLPNIYEQDGITYYRASSLGRCIRALVAQKIGFEPLAYGDKLEGIFHEGHLHEPDIIERLRKDGLDIDGSQDEVTLMVTPTVAVRGHVDGREKTGGGIVECKAFGQSTYEKWVNTTLEKFWNDYPGYAYQLSAYMYGGTAETAIYAVKNRNTGELLWRKVDAPPVSLGGLKKRVLQVEAAAKAYTETGEFPPCSIKLDYPCPYYYLHDEKEPTGLTTKDTEVEALAEAYERARDRAAQAEMVQKECRAMMIEALAGREKVESGNWSVSFSERKRTTVDIKAARQVLDLSPFEVTAAVPTLVVRNKAKGKEKKGNGNGQGK